MQAMILGRVIDRPQFYHWQQRLTAADARKMLRGAGLYASELSGSTEGNHSRIQPSSCLLTKRCLECIDQPGRSNQSMLSHKSKYALQALLALSKEYGKGLMLISEIAAREQIPKRFLELILLELKNNGVLRSKKGKGGGYSLSKPPDLLSVGPGAPDD